MSALGFFILLIIILLILAAAGWVLFTQYRARRAGLPPPALRSYIPFLGDSSSGNYPAPRATGPIEWLKDKFASIRRKRSARGAYEEPSQGSTSYTGARRGRGLDPDDAWDARVPNEADAYGPGGYYEEQELGLHTPAVTDSYGGAGYGGSSLHAAHGEGERGRSKSRDPPGSSAAQRTMGVNDNVSGRDNPFGDQHEATSLRDVSPRPVVDTAAGGHGHTRGQDSHDESPTERRSMFRESL